MKTNLDEVTALEAEELWEEARVWFEVQGARWSSARSAAISAVAEYIANQRGLTFYDKQTTPQA